MGGFVVLTVRSRRLSERHAALRALGADCDFGLYRPHLTFTTGDHPDLSEVEPFEGPLTFGPEVGAPETCV